MRSLVDEEQLTGIAGSCDQSRNRRSVLTMKASAFEVTFDEIQKYDWDSLPWSLLERDEKHQRISTHLLERAAKQFELGDPLGERVFRFLGAVTSLSPSFESKDSPYKPFLIDGTRRSAALEDLSKADGLVLGQLTTVASDPELKARLADVSAFLNFDHKVLGEAVSAYRQRPCEFIRGEMSRG